MVVVCDDGGGVMVGGCYGSDTEGCSDDMW